MKTFGRIAQLEEHLVYTERVGGSSPSASTRGREGAPSFRWEVNRAPV